MKNTDQLRPVMPCLIKNARLIDPETQTDKQADVYLRGGLIETIAPPGKVAPSGAHMVIDGKELVVCPGLIDLHVHLREPGQTHKEDIASGSNSAILGGVTSLLCMPNTDPVADTPSVVAQVKQRGLDVGRAQIYPVGALTVRSAGAQLTDFAALRQAGAIALSDDGRPLVSEELMERALRQAREQGLAVLSHCEPETEQAARDVALAEKIEAPIHICHVSRRDTVQVIRDAKARGVPVTAETCPHYLWFTEEDARRIGTNAKMNPPLATPEDRAAVIEGVRDGTIDALATDHAPHHPSEKALPWNRAPHGVIGLGTLLPASLTALYHNGGMPLIRVLAAMTASPAAILGLRAGRIEVGGPADLTVFHPDMPWRVEARLLASKSQNTPFDGMTLRGRVLHVFVGGRQQVKNSLLVDGTT